MKLQPFQYVSVKSAYEKKRFLIAHDMGMYKSAQAVFVDNVIRRDDTDTKALVVCPNSVKSKWKDEIETWAYPRGQEVFDLTVDSYQKWDGTSEWTIVHYDFLSHGKDGFIRKMKRNGFDHIILDEVHNTKNPSAIRSQSIRSLAEDPEYVTLLSGTPVPNTISDVYMLMHLLEPQEYPLSDSPDINREARQKFEAIYWNDPQVFKHLIQRKMIRGNAQDYIGHALPQWKERNVMLEMDGRWLEAYNDVLEKRLHPGKKIKQLEKILLDTSLADQSLITNGLAVSPKYEKLDEIVESETKRGKVLVFTHLKEGIVGKLERRYANYGAVSISGDVDVANGERESIRRKFQTDPRAKVLISTGVMNEGVDLTAATAVVNLSLPWTPAEYNQRIKRTVRPGEMRKERVTVYNILAQYPGDARKSLDQAQYDMLKAKERVVDYLMSGYKLTREDLLNMDGRSTVPKIKNSIKTTNRIVLDYYMKWPSIGTDGALRRIKKNPEVAKQIAEMYPNYSGAKKAASIYVPVAEKLAPSEPWLDLAGGAGMLAYHGGHPTYILDINRANLKVGRGKLGLTYSTHAEGTFSSLPYRDGSFGFVNLSLALHIAEPKKERSIVLQEVNRVLKSDGSAIVVVPSQHFDDADRNDLMDNFRLYGFECEDNHANVSSSRMDLYVLRKSGKAAPGVIKMSFAGDRKRGK
ncbi:MAG: methyltransferase domain-containing protein [Candidatus Aenigmatarchaeota archaeon]|nr:MAG: methyltransferase domain-containing protein [Candidatus Aenigmarchaeota archaeon]